MSILRPLLSIEDTPGMPEAIGAVVSASASHVCGVCGLGRMGHAPESRWLGHAPHDWAPVQAGPIELARARALTADAYAAREVRPAS